MAEQIEVATSTNPTCTTDLHHPATYLVVLKEKEGKKENWKHHSHCKNSVRDGSVRKQI